MVVYLHNHIYMIALSSLFKQSYSAFIGNVKTLLAIAAIPALLSVVVSYLEPDPQTVPSMTFIALMIITVIASLIMTVALIFAVAHKNISAKEAYLKSVPQLLRYIAYAIVSSVLILIGFILLVIPGIWLTVCFAFGAYFLLLQGTSTKESLLASKALVKGRWWGVAVRLAVLMLLGMALMIVLLVIENTIGAFIGATAAYALTSGLAVFFAPFATIYLYELYTDLQRSESTVAAEKPTQETEAIV